MIPNHHLIPIVIQLLIAKPDRFGQIERQEVIDLIQQVANSFESVSISENDTTALQARFLRSLILRLNSVPLPERNLTSLLHSQESYSPIVEVETLAVPSSSSILYDGETTVSTPGIPLGHLMEDSLATDELDVQYWEK